MKDIYTRTNSRCLRAFVAMLVLFSALVAVPKTAWAYGRGPGTEFGVQPISKLKGKVTYYQACKSMKGIEPYSRWYEASGNISNVKSSKPSVMSVQKQKTGKKTELILTAHKAGKTTITYTYKKKQYKATITVKKYESPFKKLTIGKYNYTSELKKGSTLINALDQTDGKKITVSMAKNWKLKSIECRDAKKSYPNDLSTIKNKARVPKGAGSLWITVQNKKTGGLMEVSLLKAV